MIDADMVRSLIAGEDRERPRSKQRAVGPSDLSSPCSRKLMYQILNVDRVVADEVNLAAWVGTGIHAQMERAVKRHDDWEAEQKVGVEVAKGIRLFGTLDAYHKPSHTIVDWKSVGPSALQKYRRGTPDNYRTQVAIYGLLAVLSGKYRVDNTAIVYIPRNGSMSDIHVDVHPWDQERADAAVKRLVDLHAASAAGPAVLPLLPTADDCMFCPHNLPGSDRLEIGCPGHNPTDLGRDLPAWEPREEGASA